VYPSLKKSPFECEELEQLRILYAGYKIKVVCVEGAMPGVDVQEDLEHVKNLLNTKS
jgi:3-deoxy-manno-octulosonate cytidylyltransferase (CMP-KDO synthetase)